jgi:hypothetical protein
MDFSVFSSHRPVCVFRKTVQHDASRSVNQPGVFNQPPNQQGVRKPDKNIVTPVLIADFINDSTIVLKTISGRIKGADKSYGLRV